MPTKAAAAKRAPAGKATAPAATASAPATPTMPTKATIDSANLTDSCESLQMYLQGENQRAGLGHSFMSFNHLQTLAFDNQLSICAHFGTSGHGIDYQKSVNYFFGESLMTPFADGTDPSSCVTTSSSPEALSRDVGRLREELEKQSRCPKCAIIRMKATTPSEKGMGSNLKYYRTLFESNDGLRKMTTTRKWNKTELGAVNIAVHIRRGDLVRYLEDKKLPKGQAELRLTAVSAYTSVLKQFIPKLMELGKHKFVIHLFCEGMEPPASIPDVNGKVVNLGAEFPPPLKKVISFVPGDSDAIQAFDDMCHSDILITGTSGFSHLASILCSTPVILRMPMWHSYEYIPNAITLEVERKFYLLPNIGSVNASLIAGAKFNDTRFELLWQEKHPR